MLQRMERKKWQLCENKRIDIIMLSGFISKK